MNSHLTHQQLLAHLDGELSEYERRGVTAHLHACWTCRIEMQRLESDIATILDAANEEFVPALAKPTKSWLAFDTLLARSLPAHPESLWGKLAACTRPFFGPARILVTSSVLVALVVFAYSMLRSKPVSAMEVLRQVHIADARRTSIAKDQVARERVSIRRRPRRQGPPQLEEVDAWKSRVAAYWNKSSDDPATAELEAHYKAHDVPIDLPLSAASVDRWGEAAGGNPTVSQDGADLDLIFAGSGTGSGEGTQDPVERVSLLIQPENWHVKQMTLQFPDASFEVTEEGFSLLPVSAVPIQLLARLDPQALPQILIPHVARPRFVSPVASLHPQAVDLDTAELDVFATLHHLNADLGEPVTVTRSSKEVQVGVWQLPAGRRVELIAALQGKPGVQVQSSDPVGFAAAKKLVPETLPVPPRSIAAGSPALEEEDRRILKFFGSVEQEEAFTRQTLAASTTILSHLYALRNLQAQFSPDVEKTLPPDSRLRLTTLVEDHAAAVATGLDVMRAQLAPLNAAFNIPPSGVSAAPNVANWQDDSLDALNTAKAVDHLLRSLLTTSQTSVSPDAALPQIRQDLSSLGAELSALGAAAR